MSFTDEVKAQNPFVSVCFVDSRKEFFVRMWRDNPFVFVESSFYDQRMGHGCIYHRDLEEEQIHNVLEKAAKDFFHIKGYHPDPDLIPLTHTEYKDLLNQARLNSKP